MIRHILFCKFTNKAQPGQIRPVKEAFLRIPALIDGVLSVEWGINDSPEGKNGGFTHCVLMTFRDETARQCYLCHPAHEALKEIFRSVLQDILILDYAALPEKVAEAMV